MCLNNRWPPTEGLQKFFLYTPKTMPDSLSKGPTGKGSPPAPTVDIQNPAWLKGPKVPDKNSGILVQSDQASLALTT